MQHVLHHGLGTLNPTLSEAFAWIGLISDEEIMHECYPLAIHQTASHFAFAFSCALCTCFQHAFRIITSLVFDAGQRRNIVCQFALHA